MKSPPQSTVGSRGVRRAVPIAGLSVGADAGIPGFLLIEGSLRGRIPAWEGNGSPELARCARDLS